MAQVIASTYEIEEEIGSGGGGVVYLAKHLRLGKKVTLKADKRDLKTKPEILRREVDALKNLSHTYIPQVYDFVVEDGVVYTVIDYIEGESLDKPLKRGEHFTQPQVIEWGCQLLEALCYLHSRPPHGILHSDIKPANIMLTPEGDIRLIDFNIALALGEEGAVRVGYSQGYASPEHYGRDYSSHTHMAPERQAALKSRRTTASRGTGDKDSGSSGAGQEKKVILLDVRSDIYSVGATLYHLLTGKRPDPDAKKVVPLREDVGISAAVAAIINKAMSPDPDERYQTAEEMLAAFKNLHTEDPRSKRHRRTCKVTAAILIVLFLLGGVCTFAGLKQMEKEKALEAEAARQAELAAQQEKSALSSVRASESAYQEGNLPQAVQTALEALSLDTTYNAEAQYALTNALGVYDLSDGLRPYQTITLPSAPIKVALSPDGTRLAVLISGQVQIFNTSSGVQTTSLTADESALSDIVFRDDHTLFYAGDGALRCYDLNTNQELWSGQPATGIALSGDGSTVAGVYKDATEAVIYDADTGAVRTVVDFNGKKQATVAADTLLDPEYMLFTLSEDGSWLAASFDDGAMYIFYLPDRVDDANDLYLFDESQYERFSGGFCGNYLALSAFTTKDGGDSAFMVIDLDQVAVTTAYTAKIPYYVQTDSSYIYAVTGHLCVKIDPSTGEETELAYPDSGITAFALDNGRLLTALDNKHYACFDQYANEVYENDTMSCDFVQFANGTAAVASMSDPVIRILQWSEHADANLFTYDSDYSHKEARISADNSTVMLFKNSQFRIYAMDGTVLADVEIPDSHQLYDQQYRRDETGSYLELFYNDGTIRRYSAADGSLLSEEMGELPNSDYEEEFYTDQYHIVSPLHGAATVYDRETGEQLYELESEDYLTYVTQVGDYIITEYVVASAASAQNERYGLLLNSECETLAKLPNLCDITADNTLIFDDNQGILRQSRIYSTQELISLGNT